MSSEKIDWGSTVRIYRRLLGYLRPYKWVGMGTVVGLIVDSVCLAAFTALIKPMVNGIFNLKDPHEVFWMPIYILALAAIRAFASYYSDYGMGQLARRVVQDMRVDVFASYLRLPVPYFSHEASGQQIARITYTSDQVAKAATNAVKSMISDTLLVLGLLFIMLRASWFLTLALLVMVPAIVGTMTWISRRYRRISRNLQTSMGSVAGTVQEVVRGHREVRIYGGQQREQQRFNDVADLTGRQNLKVAKTGALSSSAVQTTAAIALALLIYLASRPSVLEGIDGGTFTQMIVAMTGLLNPLKRLTSVQGDVQRGVAAAEDLFQSMDEPPESDTGKTALARSQGDLRFVDVGLTYPGADTPAVRDIQLDCPPGSVTALVGRSGSGKSTLVSLLPRFYEPQHGQILLDGADYTGYTLDSLRRQIAWVGQQVVLFDGTIAENIAYGELAGADEAAIIAAAEAANAMEFIARLPDGIHNHIGEGGNLLSGGQRQRIAIARAILKNAPILVLDEATSALDTESERLIQDALQRLMKDRTTLVIAHRLSTVEDADQIAVMEQGRIVERGTHAQLIALDGHYAALHRMQFRDPLAAQGGD